MGSPSRDSSGNSAVDGPTPDSNDAAGSVAARAGIRRRLSATLGPRLGIDARALAAFRIGVGLLVAADLLFRARSLSAFYTDSGVLPRSALAEVFPLLARLSIHTLSGSATGQGLLFLLAGCVAAVLVVGYRARAASAAALLVHASLYARNPYVVNGGDGLLLVALLLGVFLPTAERWSIESLRAGDRAPRDRVTSLATATILLQLVVVYLANAGFKLQSPAWRSGRAVQYVLELEQFSVFLGPHLAAFPALSTGITWLWTGMLALSPLLILATGRVRTVAVAAFVGAHLGMLATLRLGLFPLVVVALLLLYLPSPVWDAVERRLPDVGPGVAANRARTAAARVDCALPRAPRPVCRAGRVAATAVLVVVLLGSVLWPAMALGAPGDPDVGAIQTSGYAWTLFAPSPPTSTRWFVAPTTLASGERVDAFADIGAAGGWNGNEPPDAADTYPNALWHRYLGDVRHADDATQRHLAAYLCRRTARLHGEPATNVSVYVVAQRVEAAGGGEPRRREVFQHDCGTPAADA